MPLADLAAGSAGLLVTVQDATESLAALDRLQPRDRFNVIAFSSRPRPLYDGPRYAVPSALAEARTFIRSLEADGGTRMDGALVHALEPAIEPGYLRQGGFAGARSVGVCYRSVAKINDLVRMSFPDFSITERPRFCGAFSFPKSQEA